VNDRPDKRTGPARLARAFGSTWRGFCAAWRGEEAFRQECLLAILVVPLGLWLGQDGAERHRRRNSDAGDASAHGDHLRIGSDANPPPPDSWRQAMP